jgi:hypothetical protein
MISAPHYFGLEPAAIHAMEAADVRFPGNSRTRHTPSNMGRRWRRDPGPYFVPAIADLRTFENSHLIAEDDERSSAEMLRQASADIQRWLH